MSCRERVKIMMTASASNQNDWIPRQSKYGRKLKKIGFWSHQSHVLTRPCKTNPFLSNNLAEQQLLKLTSKLHSLITELLTDFHLGLYLYFRVLYSYLHFSICDVFNSREETWEKLFSKRRRKEGAKRIIKPQNTFPSKSLAIRVSNFNKELSIQAIFWERNDLFSRQWIHHLVLGWFRWCKKPRGREKRRRVDVGQRWKKGARR